MYHCKAYYGKSYVEARRTTIGEYEFLRNSYSLRDQKIMQYIHMLAWKINEAQAQKEVGKRIVPVHKTFKDFYDAEGEYYKALLGEEEYKEERRKEKAQIAEVNKLLHKNLGKEDSLNEIADQNRRIEEALNKQ